MSGASGLRPHNHSSAGQGGVLAGAEAFQVVDSATIKFASGYNVLESNDQSASLELNPSDAILSNGPNSVLVNNNGVVLDGTGAKQILYGGYGAVLPLLASDPSGPHSEEGQVYYNTASHKLRQYNGTSWFDIGTLVNPMTTQDDVIVAGASGAPTRLAKGSDSQVLTVDPSTHHLVWATPSAGLTNPMTTQDDIIVGGASGTPGRLAKGSDNQVLTVDPSTHHLVWATPSSGFADPMTTRGDSIIRNSSNTTARLAVGAANRLMGSDGTDPSWRQATESDLNLTDVTTGNAATGQHGFLKKLDNNAAHYMDGTGAWSTPGGGGGVTYGQAYPYPTSFTGDSEDMSSAANWTDISAFSTKEILNSTILHLVTLGPSHDHRVRKTLGTTKAAAFDFRFNFMFAGLYWSGSKDVYFEIVLRATGGGSIIAIARVSPRTASGGFNQDDLGLEVGTTAVVGTNIDPPITLGLPVWLRIARDGSNVLTFQYALGTAPLGYMTKRVASDNTSYAPTSSGTVAEVDFSIHTPSGPGSTVNNEVFIDTFESV